MREVRDLLKNERDIRDETRDKLARLDSPRKRRSMMFTTVESIHEETMPGNYSDDTQSLLSDMSLTRSEDDFLDCHTSKQWRRHRPSNGGGGATTATGGPSSNLNVSGKRLRLSTERKRRSSSRVIEVGAMDRIVASTKVSVPRSGDGPIVAESVISSKPMKRAAPAPPTSTSEDIFETPQKNKTPFASKRSRSPTAPPAEDEIHYAAKTVVPRTPMTRNTAKPHNFQAPRSMFVQSEMCSHCGKKFRFGANCVKCEDCKAKLHMQCRDLFTVNCIPITATTPKHRKGHVGGTVADYAPTIGPMVPALIVHCVNEIESRGLAEEGVYRHCGSDLLVKQLKEAFLRGKTIPPVSSVLSW